MSVYGKILAFLLVLSLLCVSCQRFKDLTYPEKTSQEEKKEKYERQIEELRKSLKGDIKVKLKRDAKGNYSWEIQGRDVGEVLKANEALKKRLSD